MWQRSYEVCFICSTVSHSSETCPSMQYHGYYDQNSMFGEYQANQEHWNDHYALAYNLAWEHPPYSEWNSHPYFQEGSYNGFEASSYSYYDPPLQTSQGESLEDSVASMTNAIASFAQSTASFSQNVATYVQNLDAHEQSFNESVDNIGRHLDTILAYLTHEPREQVKGQDGFMSHKIDWSAVDEFLETMAPPEHPPTHMADCWELPTTTSLFHTHGASLDSIIDEDEDSNIEEFYEENFEDSNNEKLEAEHNDNEFHVLEEITVPHEDQECFMWYSHSYEIF
ncbi:hypothetical protein ACLB2K_037340 [Fragaria x ananassa]